ncbi:4-hydroxythreonine-4-phosphate dehydrogenase PdxA [Oscillospiraceae bacterium MB08-C2-2]|nr:4-hydroxythreonine-4-phosphate dehydrogenase PdxA [Oscillospiraceae bacterium MB08-C2-2]
MYKPIVGITMGDPFGNGPELTVKALADRSVYQRCRPMVVGDIASLQYAIKTVAALHGITIRLNPISAVSEAKYEYGVVDVLNMGMIQPHDIPGDPEHPRPFGLGATKLGGEAAFSYVEKVIELAMAKEIDATVTNSISKEAINMAGHHFSGHTEIYAHYTGTEKYTMMLAHDDLRVVHVSTHVSLRDACDKVTKDRVLEVIRIAHQGCLEIGIENPKIGVAGLNPHCGENGMFGREEIDEIQPAIDLALAEGINIPEKKPTPPDTIFSKALGGWYDMVVAMYHDQGHIPLKVKGFVYNRAEGHWDAVAGVNITLGLPIIRTSVDHGTGIDRAGDGRANELSLVNAIDYAIVMANTKKAAKL